MAESVIALAALGVMALFVVFMAAVECGRAMQDLKERQDADTER
jgi:hypothetical protein